MLVSYAISGEGFGPSTTRTLRQVDWLRERTLKTTANAGSEDKVLCFITHADLSWLASLGCSIVRVRLF